MNTSHAQEKKIRVDYKWLTDLIQKDHKLTKTNMMKAAARYELLAIHILTKR
jgi:hypothetical protein